MKLRSYPDTVESKQRKIGMYKSPAPSGRKPKTASSSMVSKSSARKPKSMNMLIMYIQQLKDSV